MSTQNNAAQAAAQILTYLGFAQAVSMEPAADPRRDHIQALIESALLSKLRAPVTGEAQADDLNKKLFEAAILDLAAISEHLGLDPDEGGAEPIIGAIDELRRERDSWVKAQRAADDEAAPQASPAADGRDSVNVVAVLAYRSNGRRGAHGQTIGADGSGDFVVLYRGDEFAALVKANEEIRTLEAAGHRLSFAAIVHGEGYSGPVIRHEYVTRAAIAAQQGEGEG